MSIDKESFRAGARAMFDALAFRAANNWHPSHPEVCYGENELVMRWARDSLEEVSPEDCSEWESVRQAYTEGYKAGKKIVELKVPRTIVGRLMWVLRS